MPRSKRRVGPEDIVTCPAELVHDINSISGDFSSKLHRVLPLNPAHPIAPFKPVSNELGLQVVADVEESIYVDLRNGR